MKLRGFYVSIYLKDFFRGFKVVKLIVKDAEF